MDSATASQGAVSPEGQATSPGSPDDDPFEIHHLLPKKFRAYFERAGLDIEDHTLTMRRSEHRLRPGGVHTGPDNWNKQWADFFNNNPNANANQILNQLKVMRQAFGI